jgi:hypothetical protein
LSGRGQAFGSDKIEIRVPVNQVGEVFAVDFLAVGHVVTELEEYVENMDAAVFILYDEERRTFHVVMLRKTNSFGINITLVGDRDMVYYVEQAIAFQPVRYLLALFAKLSVTQYLFNKRNM